MSGVPQAELDEDAVKTLDSGTLEFVYECGHVQHLSTRHFVLDLERHVDAAVAVSLFRWAAAVNGEAIRNVLVDGERAALGDAISARRDLPSDGILELDYTVLCPVNERLPQPSATGAMAAGSGRYVRPEQHRLRWDVENDLVVATRLEQLAYSYPGDEWLPAVLPQRPSSASPTVGQEVEQEEEQDQEIENQSG